MAAGAAYRSGSAVEDDDGQVSDFSRKRGVAWTHIFAPDDAPDWMSDQQKLWNAVDRSETRKDARLAREFNVALPKELTREQQIGLIQDFVQECFVERHRMVCDVALHDKENGNPHFHLMHALRAAGPDGFSKTKATTKEQGDWYHKDQLREFRADWARHANLALERAGIHERIDHRTLQAQGIDREPTQHIGRNAKRLHEKGLLPESEIVFEKRWRRDPETGRKRLEDVAIDYPSIDQGRKPRQFKKDDPIFWSKRMDGQHTDRWPNGRPPGMTHSYYGKPLSHDEQMRNADWDSRSRARFVRNTMQTNAERSTEKLRELQSRVTLRDLHSAQVHAAGRSLSDLFGSVFRHPDEAREQFDNLARRAGFERSVAALRDSPRIFGSFRGGLFSRRRSDNSLAVSAFLYRWNEAVETAKHLNEFEEMIRRIHDGLDRARIAHLESRIRDPRASYQAFDLATMYETQILRESIRDRERAAYRQASSKARQAEIEIQLKEQQARSQDIRRER